MIRKSTWILLALFLLALAAVLYMDRNDISLAQTTPTTTVAPGVFVGVNFAALEKIEAQTAPTGEELTGMLNPGGRLALQKRADGTWMFATLDGDAADQGRVQQLISSLVSLAPLSELDLTSPLDATGLNNPSTTLQLSFTDGKQSVLTIGEPTRTGSGYYARLDNNQKVLVLSKYAVEDVVSLLNVNALSVMATESPFQVLEPTLVPTIAVPPEPAPATQTPPAPTATP